MRGREDQEDSQENVDLLDLQDHQGLGALMVDLDLMVPQDLPDLRVPLVTRDHQVLLVYQDNVVYLDLKGPREAEVTQDFLDLRVMWVNKVNEDPKVYLDLLDPLEKLEVLETQDRPDLQEKLEHLELWDPVDHLDLRVCKGSLDLLVYLVCLVSRVTEDYQEIRDPRVTLDLLAGQENQGHLDSLD
jgi:hypothetical protein